MTDPIKAIETEYAGCRFRSRLEARWAVFFDQLDIRWNYEPQGFEVDGVRYLPDFELPDMGERVVEVKGHMDARDMLKVLTLAAVRPVLLLQDIPRPDQAGPHFLLFLATVGRGRVARRVSFVPYWGGWSLGGSGGDISGPSDLDVAVGWALDLIAIGPPVDVQPEPIRAATQSRVISARAEVADAFKAARSARFEHGERG